MRLATVLFVLVCVVGCDSSVPPLEPAPVPAGEAPGDLRLTASLPERVTIAWSDRSDDETAFRVELAQRPHLDRLLGTDRFVPLDTLAPGTTSFTDLDIRDTSARLYRVVAVGADAGGDAVSEPLALVFPVHRTVLAGLAGAAVVRAAFPVREYTATDRYLAVETKPASVQFYDLESGQHTGKAPGFETVIGMSNDGLPLVARSVSTPSGPTVQVARVSRTVGVGPSFTLDLDPTSGCDGAVPQGIRSRGNEYILGSCGSRLVGWYQGGYYPSDTTGSIWRMIDGLDPLAVSGFQGQTPAAVIVMKREGQPTMAISLFSFDKPFGAVVWRRTQPSYGTVVSGEFYSAGLLDGTNEGVDVVDGVTGATLASFAVDPVVPRRMAVDVSGRNVAFLVQANPWVLETGPYRYSQLDERVRVQLREGQDFHIRYRRVFEFVRVGLSGRPELWDWQLSDSWQEADAAVPA